MKINVFISSRCEPEQKALLSIRAGLKQILVNTGLFEVFLFEDSSASSHEVSDFYLNELIRCNLCLFLIDTDLLTNTSGGGVLKEIMFAEQHGIRQLYIFEKPGNGKNQNIDRLQVTKKYKEVELKDFIAEGLNAILYDLVSNFYPFSSINPISNTFEANLINEQQNNSREQELKPDEYIPNKNIIISTPNTLKTITDYLQGRELLIASNQDNQTDSLLNKFVFTLLSPSKKSMFSFKEIRDYFINSHPVSEQTVIETRFEVLEQIYFYANPKEAYSKLVNQFENSTIIEQTPSWIVNDILLDLRYLYQICFGEAFFLNPWQKEIDKRIQPFYYPILDRYKADIFYQFDSDNFEEFVRQFGSFNLSSWSNKYGNNLTKYIFTALYNGSFISIEQFKKYLFSFSWKLFQEDQEAIIYFIVSLKLLMISNDFNRFKKITDKYMYCLSNASQELLCSLFEDSLALQLKDVENKWFIRLFSYLGNFLNSQNYRHYLSFFLCSFDKANTYGSMGELLQAIKNNASRIDFIHFITWIDTSLSMVRDITIILKILECISSYELNKLTKDNINRLFSFITNHIEKIKIEHAQGEFLKLLVKMYFELVDERETIFKVADNLNSDYQQHFNHFIKIQSGSDITDVFEKMKTLVLKRNAEYGKNNSWKGYNFEPLYFTFYALTSENKNFSEDTPEKIFDMCILVLSNDMQPYDNKLLAIDILFQLFQFDKDLKQKLKKIDITLDGHEVFSVGKKVEFELSFALLMVIANNQCSMLDNYLQNIDFNSNDVKNAIARRYYLITKNLTEKNIPKQLMIKMVDFFIITYRSDRTQQANYATLFFLSILKCKDYQTQTINMLVKLSHFGDSPIRQKILDHIEAINKINHQKAITIIDNSRTDNHIKIKEKIAAIDSLENNEFGS